MTDHYPIFQVTDSVELHKKGPKFIKCRSFNQHGHHLQLTNWDDIIDDLDPARAYSNFINKCNVLYNRCFPLKNKRITRAKGIPQKPWITKAILKSIKRKDKLYRKFRSSPTDSN